MLMGLAFGLGASALAQAGPARPGVPPRTATAPPAAAAKLAQPQPAPAVQAQPVVPPRPEQMAPVPPQVTYQNGQLSILAQNSTLSSILAAVRARTGARMEIPPDAANERVATQLGPGNPRDVLDALLMGSRFNYIFIGSPTDPEALAEVILTNGAGAGTPANTGGNHPMPSGGNPQPTMPNIAGGAGRPEVTGDEEDNTPPVAQQPPVQPQVEPGGPGPPGAIVSPGGDRGDIEQQQQTQPQQQGPNQVKTPEQLLQELQRMQQQQQQPQQPPPQRPQQQQQE